MKLKDTPRAHRQPLTSTVTAELSSGNVFADLDLPDASQLQLKSALIYHIEQLMQEKNVSPADLAAAHGLAPGALSSLFEGDLDRFSVDRLLTMINGLGRNVEVHIGTEDCTP